MRVFSRIIVAAAVVLGAGCASTVNINHDYDTGADFSKYKTFGWMPQPTTSMTGNAQDAMQRNQLLDKRILSIVNEQLQAKGLTIDTQSPDLMLAYHTGMQDKQEVSNWGYGYPRGYGAWGYQGIEVSNYTEGTLILDFIDGESKTLVWRSAASSAIDKRADPNQRDKELTEIIARMLAKYPPPGK